MLVYDPACGSEQTFPPALPCLIRKINILDIERMVERIQTADRLILLAVDRTGTTAGPQHRDCFAGLVERTDFIVPKFKKSSIEASARLASFFTAASSICKKNL